MTDSVELIALNTVMDSGFDNTDKMTKKLSKEDEDFLNRETAENISETMDDYNNRCTDGDAVDTTIEADISDTINLEAEKSRNDDKALSEKLGFNHFMIESIWKVGLIRRGVNDVTATWSNKQMQYMCQHQINVAIRNAVSVGPLQRNTFKEDVLVENIC